MIKVLFDEKDIVELKGIMEQIYYKLRPDVPDEMLRAVETATNAAFTLAGQAKRFENELPFFPAFERLFSVTAQYINSNKRDKGLQDLAVHLGYANQIIQRMVKKALEEALAIIRDLQVVQKKTTKGLKEINRSLRRAA